MLRQTIYHKRLVVALNQRLNVINEFFSDVVAFLVHPAPGNQFFVISNAVNIVDACGTHIRVIWNTVDNNHLTCIAFVSGFDSSREASAEAAAPADPVELVARLESEGIPRKEAMRQAAKTLNMSRRDIYNLLLQAEK